MSKLSAGASDWTPSGFNVNAAAWTPTFDAPDAPAGEAPAPAAAAEEATEETPPAAAAPAAAAPVAAEAPAVVEAAAPVETPAAPAAVEEEDDDWETVGNTAVAADKTAVKPEEAPAAVEPLLSKATVGAFAAEEGAWGDEDDDEETVAPVAPTRTRQRLVPGGTVSSDNNASSQTWTRSSGSSASLHDDEQARSPAMPASSSQGSLRQQPPPQQQQQQQQRSNVPQRQPQQARAAVPKEYTKPSWARVGDESVEATTLKRAKAIMNKITVEKFDRLASDFTAIDFSTEALVNGAIDMIVDKAQQETHFVDIYAELCTRLAATPLSGLGETEKGKKFRQLLLERCQYEFERDQSQVVADMELMGERERELTIKNIRKAYIGHMFFIGALYKQEMLKEKVLHHCIQELFGEGAEAPDDEKIECLSKLLTKVGKKLDAEAMENPKSQKLVKAYFKQLKKLAKSQLLSSRVRFMVRDLCELRECEWKPRREEETAKTIEQIHEEAQREADIKAGIKPKKKKQVVVDDGKANVLEDDGWETVGTAAGMRRNLQQEEKPVSSRRTPAVSNGAFDALMGSDKKKKKKKEEPKKTLKKKSSSSSLNGKAPAEAAPAETAAFSEETYRAKSKAAIAEYMSIEQLPEVIATLTQDLRAAPPAMRSLFVSTGLDVFLLNGKSTDRSRLGGLIVGLLEAKAIDPANVQAGFLEILEFLPDLLIDIPKASEWLADALKVVIAGSTCDLGFLDTCPIQSDEEADKKVWQDFKALFA